MHIEEAIAAVGQGSPVTVAVLSTGVDTDHPDLQGKLLSPINLTRDTSAGHDPLGQGTFLAGLIAANRNNGIGIDGVCPWAKILPVKVINDEGTGTVETLAEGIRRATDEGADLILVGYGSYVDYNELRDAVEYAHQNTVSVVAPAGNLGLDIPFYPAAYDTVVGVGGITESKEIGNSNYGIWVDVVAPGKDVKSLVTVETGETVSIGRGTAIASALVSGVLALKSEIWKDEVEDLGYLSRLYTATEKIFPVGSIKFSKYERVNAYKFVTESAGDEGGNLTLINHKIIPEKGVSGGQVVVDITYENSGNKKLDQGKIRFYASDDSRVDGSDTRSVIEVFGLNTGEVVNRKIIWQLPVVQEKLGRLCSYMITVRKSYTRDMLKPSLIQSGYLQVDQNEVHDIKVEDFKLISANDEVSGVAEVVNRGSEDEEKVNVELIINGNSFVTKTIPSLNAGEIKQVYFSLKQLGPIEKDIIEIETKASLPNVEEINTADNRIERIYPWPGSFNKIILSWFFGFVE